MMEYKYTYYEIVKALEDCSDGSGTGIIRATIDLIKRQNAKIKMLERKLSIAEDCIDEVDDALCRGSHNDWAEKAIEEYYSLVNEMTNKLEENNNER